MAGRAERSSTMSGASEHGVPNGPKAVLGYPEHE